MSGLHYEDDDSGFVNLPFGAAKQISQQVTKNRRKRGDVLTRAAWNHIAGSPSTRRQKSPKKASSK